MYGDPFDIMSEGDMDLIDKVFENHEKVRQRFADFKYKKSAYFIENNIRNYMFVLTNFFFCIDCEEFEDLSEDPNAKYSIEFLSNLYPKFSKETKEVFDNFFEGFDDWFERDNS